MSLDGLRAWIGEVERKLGTRTRVFLVLVVLALGAAGAAIYLSVDTRNDTVSNADVQALRAEVEARLGEGGSSGASEFASEIEALRSEVEALKAASEGGAKDGAAKSGSEESEPAPEAPAGAGTPPGTGAIPPGVAEGSAKVQEILKKAEEAAGKNAP